MSVFRIILKNGDNIIGGIHPNSSKIDRLFSPLCSDLCPHGIYLYSKNCSNGCYLLIRDRLYIPNKNVSFLLEKKILGEHITVMDMIRGIICKFKHSIITTDESNQYKNEISHFTIVSCKRCGIYFRQTSWSEVINDS